MFDQRGLSNTLGFVLLFSVVLASIAITGTVGFDLLQDARDGTVEYNAENAMKSVQKEIAGLRVDNTPLRSAIIRSGDGSVQPDDQLRRVRVDFGNDGSFELDRQTRPLIYQFENSELIYELGAVLRIEGSGQFPVSAPELSENADTFIFPLVTTEASTPDRSLSGGTISTYFQLTESRLVGHTTSGESVRIVIDTTPNRAEAWRDMISREDLNPDSCSGTGGTVDCVWTRQNVIVRHLHVSYSIVG